MKISFIGAGNIASAIIGGITKDGFLNKDDISVYDISCDVLKKFEADGFLACKELKDALMSDIIFLTVKPQFYDDVLKILFVQFYRPINILNYHLCIENYL